MANISQSIPLSIIKFNDTTGVFAVQASTLTKNANLQEWQNSAGAVLSNVTSNGGIDLNGVSGTISGSGTNQIGDKLNLFASLFGFGIQAFRTVAYVDANSAFSVRKVAASGNRSSGVDSVVLYETGAGQFLLNSASAVGLMVKGAASQTANLQEWLNSSGTVLSSINNAGALSFSNTVGDKIYLFGTEYGIGIQDYATVIFASSNTAGRVSIRPGYGSANADAIELFTSGRIKQTLTEPGSVGNIIKGAASQTADLQQWQNSSGTVLSAISSGGGMVIGRSNLLGSSSFTIQAVTPMAFYSTDNTTGLHSRILFLRGNTTGNTMSLTSKGDTANGVGALVISDGAFSKEITGFGYNGNVYTNIQSASTVGLTIKGAASQTADLQQWQNSSGGVLAFVNPNGSATFIALSTTADINAYYGKISANTQASGFLGQISAIATSASTIGMVIRGAASQTANLQEWQNSAGTVLARVSSGGAIVTSAVGVFGAQSNTPNAQLYVLANNVTLPTFVVKSISSQTGNLTEWQNSSGTVLASFASDGKLNLNTSGTGYINIGDGQLYKGPGNGFIFNSDISVIDGKGVYSSLASFTNTTSVSTVPLTVKGIASQTANLQQWQNSSGAIIAYVRNDGVINGQEVRTISNYVMLREENSGGLISFIRQTAVAANPGSNQARLYFRDGTNAGTLKLVVRAGASGAETTILDNIPQ